MCGELCADDSGARVTLLGWVNRRRDLGGLVFLELRDWTGIVQIVVEPESEAFKEAEKLRSEYVVEIVGILRLRPKEQRSSRYKTGEVEVLAASVKVLSKSATPPFVIDTTIKGAEIAEELRLRYRYLDLRRPDAANPIRLRHRITKSIWDFLDSEGFVQVETPLLTLSTPEGARDYLVPARTQPSSFYALPQSPQLFKQMLMVAGFEKYFQIARCFRDEDLRADRQPDFTQLDIELSFVEQDDILSLNERLMKEVVQQTTGRTIGLPFLRIPYQQAMDEFGTDKPDLRNPLRLRDFTEAFRESSFEPFHKVIEGDGVVKGLALDGANLSRKQITGLEDIAKKNGAKGLGWVRHDSDGLRGPLAKFLSESEKVAIENMIPSGGLALMVADQWNIACGAMGAVRVCVAEFLNLFSTDNAALAFAWVVDFPLLEVDSDGSFTYMHHPFTRVRDEDAYLLATYPERARSWAYDLVLNGIEIGGGSLRNHQVYEQQRMFELLGFSAGEISKRFGFLMEALKYGAPPHGGIAWGLDRLVMILSGTSSLRDVIAFPKNRSGADPLTGAPSPVDKTQLEDLGIQVKEKQVSE
jgi:aspartyl-tRNA synthetase